jgi:hypothetical protein
LSQKLRLFYFVSLLKTQALCPEGSTWDEVRGLSAEFERFEKKHNDFAVRTTNEIDELFAKVDARGALAGSRLAPLGYEAVAPFRDLIEHISDFIVFLFRLFPPGLCQYSPSYCQASPEAERMVRVKSL